MRFLLLLFIATPLIEMWVLIKVGGVIGALPTVALVLLTAMVGLALLRQQGASTLWRFQRRMEEGQLPAVEIIEGMALAVGGALLLTPGFVTDAIGFALLIPPLRQGLIHRIARRMVVQGGSTQFHSRTEEVIIEGEFTQEDDRHHLK